MGSFSRHCRSKLKGRGKSQGKIEVPCLNCGDKRHFNNKSHKAHEDNNSVNSAEDIRDALILSVNSPMKSSILNSGALFHSSPSRELFQNSRLENLGRYILRIINHWRLLERGCMYQNFKIEVNGSCC